MDFLNLKPFSEKSTKGNNMDIFPLNSWADILIDEKEKKVTKISIDRCIDQINWYGCKGEYTKSEIDQTIKQLKKTIKNNLVESEFCAKKHAKDCPEEVFFYIDEIEGGFAYAKGARCSFHSESKGDKS